MIIEFPFVVFVACLMNLTFSYDASSHKYKVKYLMGVFMRHPFNFRNISARECISQKADQYKFSKEGKVFKVWYSVCCYHTGDIG